MQEALGTDQTDLNRSAWQSSADLDTDRPLHFFPCIAFNSLIRTLFAVKSCRPAISAAGAGSRQCLWDIRVASELLQYD
ncbi:MAG: hypothetical protein ABIK82_06770 [Pseudomonadota bacterium]